MPAGRSPLNGAVKDLHRALAVSSRGLKILCEMFDGFEVRREGKIQATADPNGTGSGRITNEDHVVSSGGSFGASVLHARDVAGSPADVLLADIFFWHGIVGLAG